MDHCQRCGEYDPRHLRYVEGDADGDWLVCPRCAEHRQEEINAHPTGGATMNERCTRCGGWLIGSERLSETCNRCPDLGYESMSDEEYDALYDAIAAEAEYERRGDEEAKAADARTWYDEYDRPYLSRALAIAALAASLLLPTHAQAQSSDPRIAQVIRAQELRFPAPVGCDVVGGWEDGSIVAYCIADDSWLAHGPDSDDEWSTYTGPLMPVWEDRATP